MHPHPNHTPYVDGDIRRPRACLSISRVPSEMRFPALASIGFPTFPTLPHILVGLQAPIATDIYLDSSTGIGDDETTPHARHLAWLWLNH